MRPLAGTVTPSTGTAALFLSALTAAALLLHISHNHDAAWRPSGGRPEQQPPEQQQPLSEGDYLEQLLCGIGGGGGRDSRSSQDSRGGGSLRRGGGGGGGGGGAAGTLRLPAVRQRSWAAAHIEHDLRRWRRRGFERSALDAVVANASYQARLLARIDPHSWGDRINAFRFQIVDGELYVDTSQIPYDREDGRVTAPGNMSISGRAPIAMLALQELLYLYPGQVPDVDALMIFSDTPWVEVADDPGAPPLFAPCSDDAHVEVPFPDWSFWAGSKGWDLQRAQLLAAAAVKPLAERTPALMYRGRADTGADAKRAAIVACREQLPPERRHLIDAKSVNWLQHDHRVSATAMCDWRYLIYIEAYGWSASLKTRLACGSLLLQVKPRWVEWFSRGLRRNEHYLEVPSEPLDAICPAVGAALAAAERGFAAGASRGDEATSDGSAHAAAGQAPDPVAIGAAGTAFVQRQLRMQDVREYMLDLLTAYAALQRFKPEPTPGAERVTAAALLDHFLYQEDRAEITRAHPWLACAAERGL